MNDEALRARLYSTLHDGTEGDEAFYRSACAGSQSVLELGCGAGRILGVLANDGDVLRRIVGLELDDALLTLAETRFGHVAGVELAKADITDFDLGERFDRVIMPFTTLFALGGADAVSRCLNATRRHLKDDGVLILDTYAVSTGDMNASDMDASDDEENEDDGPSDLEWEHLAGIALDGQRVEVWERDVWHATPGCVEVNYRFEMLTPQGEVQRIVEQHIIHTMLTWGTLWPLLEDAGFSSYDVRGDFDGGAYDPDECELMVVVAAP